MSPMNAIYIVRSLLTDAPPELATVAVPLDAAQAIASLAERAPDAVGDLIIALQAIDVRDCTAAMVDRRQSLASRLRIDPHDSHAAAQARDLITTVNLRRTVHDALADALADGEVSLASALKRAIVAANMEVPGWQSDALTTLDAGAGLGALTDEGQPMSTEVNTHRLILALIARSREGMPCAVPLPELGAHDAPSPQLIGRVMADMVFGPVVARVLAREGVRVTYQRKPAHFVLTPLDNGDR